jgi:hypothetical protein
MQNADTRSSLHITDEAEACAAVLTACLRSNEIYGMIENVLFPHILRSRNMFRGRDVETLLATTERYFEQAGSPGALIDAAIGAVREQTRLPLFYQCLDLMLSDGVVTPQEHKMFLYLKKKFKVAEDTAWKAMDVLLAKNQL